MATRQRIAVPDLWRDRVAAALMLFAALGALSAFAGAVGTVAAAGPETTVVESWRMYGFSVFAGLFVLLALRPRSYPGVWELVILHKTAMAITASVFIAEAEDAALVAAGDGAVAALVVVAYVLSRGYEGWGERGREHRRGNLRGPGVVRRVKKLR